MLAPRFGGAPRLAAALGVSAGNPSVRRIDNQRRARAPLMRAAWMPRSHQNSL